MRAACETGDDYAEGYSAGEADSGRLGWFGIDFFLFRGKGEFGNREGNTMKVEGTPALTG